MNEWLGPSAVPPRADEEQYSKAMSPESPVARFFGAIAKGLGFLFVTFTLSILMTLFKGLTYNNKK